MNHCVKPLLTSSGMPTGVRAYFPETGMALSKSVHGLYLMTLLKEQE